MKMICATAAAAALIAVCLQLALAAEVGSSDKPLSGDPYANETKAQRDERMAWWRDAKFGMFIHWGVYAVPAGMYEGEEVRGIGEWIMRNAKIPSAEYRGYAKDFTAADYDPKAWAALAKKAGMRYMVITSKHHDGFALYPSEVTDWDVEAAACKRDLLAPLAEAARAEGLKFGLYYSQSQDWMHPGGAIFGYDEGVVINEDHQGSYDEYLKTIAVPQTREILERYQPDVLWWDTPMYMTAERAQPLAELLKLQPGIIHNNRLGGGYAGDTDTPEQFIPPRGYPGRDWETCMTMNNTWGYKSYDDNWKSAATLITNLVDVASKGGNYLLNIGPDARGRIPNESVKLLKEVGAWMKVNGESIYGTQASPFGCRLEWGRCTVKPDDEQTTLYLHVMQWPGSREILLPGLENPVLSAQMLVDGSKLETRKGRHGQWVVLPAKAVDEQVSVVKLVFQGLPEVREAPVLADSDGVIRLTPVDARLQGELRLGRRGGHDAIVDWTHAEDSISWTFEAAETGSYKLQVHTAADQAGAVLMVKGVGKLAVQVPKTKNLGTFEATEVGGLELEKGQQVTMSLHAVCDGWKRVHVKIVELMPVRK